MHLNIILDNFLSFLKLLVRFQKPKLSGYKKRYKRLIVLGNGPSFKNQRDQLIEINDCDYLGVNYFACTDAMEQFKPSIYVIASPQYWMNDLQNDWSKTRNKVFDCMLNKTTWQMSLFVPIIAKSDAKWKSKMQSNPYISINYINLSPIDHYSVFFRFLLKRFYVCPRPHNVLVPSILCAINVGYNEIYLAGADHSWIPEITVTTKNEVLIAQKHFYNDSNRQNSLLSDKAKPMYSAGSQSVFKLHEVLQKFYYSFKSYWILKEYAAEMNAEVYNLLGTSFIDAYKKIDISEITSPKALKI